MYKVRVDINKDIPREVVYTFIENESKGEYCYAYEEVDGGNPHVQGLIVSGIETKKDDTALRNRLRKLLPKGGNKAYSLTKCKEVSPAYPIEYLAYLKKGGQAFYEFPESVMKEVDEYDAKYHADVKKKEASKAKNVIQSIEEFIKTKPEFRSFDKFCLRQWIHCVIDFYKFSEKRFKEFDIVSYSQTLFLKHNEGGAKYLEQMICDRIFK